MVEKVPVRVGLCPNGYFLIIPFCIVLFTLALTTFGQLSCQYATVTEEVGIIQRNSTSRGIGLWVQEKVDSENREEGTWKCEGLDSDDMDSWMKTARACSFISLCLGFGAAIMLCIFGVIRVRESALRHMFVCLCCFLTGVSICMVMTVFVFLADICDDNDCEWDWGATLSMIASGGWAAAAFTLCCCTPIIQREREVKEKKPKHVDEEDPKKEEPKKKEVEDDDDDDNQSTEFIETVDKTERDGAVYRITKTTITHRNGRKTVTQDRKLIKAAPAAAIIAARDKREEEPVKEEEEEPKKRPVPVVVNKSENKEEREEEPVKESLGGPDPVVVNNKKEEFPAAVDDDSPHFVDHSDFSKHDPPSRSMMMADRDASAKAQDRKGGFFCGDMEFCT